MRDMTDEELEHFLSEVRAGRQEDNQYDWKRKFWAPGKEGLDYEFLRDVSAMANSACEDSKWIIIGLRSSGELEQSELPGDEAGLQQRLRNITPLPNIRFHRRKA